jgi:hypothetical protein
MKIYLTQKLLITDSWWLTEIAYLFRSHDNYLKNNINVLLQKKKEGKKKRKKRKEKKNTALRKKKMLCCEVLKNFVRRDVNSSCNYGTFVTEQTNKQTNKQKKKKNTQKQTKTVSREKDTFHKGCEFKN